MKLCGHKRTKDFYKYIRITPEEAEIKIKELWLSSNDMKLIKDTEAINFHSINSSEIIYSSSK